MIKKKDFVEIDFIGKVKGGETFDTNVASEIKRMNLNLEAKPVILCIGENMILPAIDEFLVGKTLGDYTLELESKKAFGDRRKDLIKTMPSSVFRNAQQVPQPGMIFSFDNMLGKISAVSGGRVIVDFNNPIAGKDVIYNIKVKKILEDINEKVKAIMMPYFGKEFPFKVEGKKLILDVEKRLVKIIEFFKPKFKETLDLDLEVKEVPDVVSEVKEDN